MLEVSVNFRVNRKPPYRFQGMQDFLSLQSRITRLDFLLEQIVADSVLLVVNFEVEDRILRVNRITERWTNTVT